MIAQRADKENTTVYCAPAEKLPFEANSFDAALAVLTIHHWSDWQKGLQEAMRVARSKIVLFTWVGMPNGFWLFDYFPEIEGIDKALFPSVKELAAVLGNIQVKTVPIPADCTDGFLCAYWSRPESYLDPMLRSAISTFSRIDGLEKGLAKLSDELKTGEWERKYRFLKDLPDFDFGYRLVVSAL
ncbi:MAG: class I SAM-dependent methyltransferase [Thiolinea sp.]